jgi:hypothetical protein
MFKSLTVQTVFTGLNGREKSTAARPLRVTPTGHFGVVVNGAVRPVVARADGSAVCDLTGTAKYDVDVCRAAKLAEVMGLSKEAVRQRLKRLGVAMAPQGNHSPAVRLTQRRDEARARRRARGQRRRSY